MGALPGRDLSRVGSVARLDYPDVGVAVTIRVALALAGESDLPAVG